MAAKLSQPSPQKERPDYFAMDIGEAFSLCATTLARVERTIQVWDGYPNPYFLREQLLSLTEAMQFLGAMTNLLYKDYQNRQLTNTTDDVSEEPFV